MQVFCLFGDIKVYEISAKWITKAVSYISGDVIF